MYICKCFHFRCARLSEQEAARGGGEGRQGREGHSRVQGGRKPSGLHLQVREIVD